MDVFSSARRDGTCRPTSTPSAASRKFGFISIKPIPQDFEDHHTNDATRESQTEEPSGDKHLIEQFPTVHAIDNAWMRTALVQSAPVGFRNAECQQDAR